MHRLGRDRRLRRDDDDAEPAATQEPAAAETPISSPIKDYLLEHTRAAGGRHREDLVRRRGVLRARQGRRLRLPALLADKRDEVKHARRGHAEDFRDANPAYEEMEGVVAGVPSLADFDVIIDAGGDKSDPENAVPFSIKTPAGKTFKQPGNFNFLIETSLCGTEPKFAAKGVEPDLDGDGKVEFGEAVPDADFLVAAGADFAHEREGARRGRRRLGADRAGRVHRARRDDADDVGVLRERGRTRASSPAPRRPRSAFVAASRLRRHRRHPQRPRAGLRQRRADHHQGEPRAGRADRRGRSRSCTSSPSSCATRRRPARSSRAQDADTLGATRRTAPRRSPARSPRPPASSGSSSRL